MKTLSQLFAIIVAATLVQLATAADVPKAASPEAAFDNFKAAFVNEAGHYNGVTGSTALDAAGDRENGDFDFWAVRLSGAMPIWVRIGGYNNGVLTLF